MFLFFRYRCESAPKTHLLLFQAKGLPASILIALESDSDSGMSSPSEQAVAETGERKDNLPGSGVFRCFYLRSDCNCSVQNKNLNHSPPVRRPISSRVSEMFFSDSDEEEDITAHRKPRRNAIRDSDSEEEEADESIGAAEALLLSLSSEEEVEGRRISLAPEDSEQQRRGGKEEEEEMKKEKRKKSRRHQERKEKHSRAMEKLKKKKEERFCEQDPVSFTVCDTLSNRQLIFCIFLIIRSSTPVVFVSFLEHASSLGSE